MKLKKLILLKLNPIPHMACPQTILQPMDNRILITAIQMEFSNDPKTPAVITLYICDIKPVSFIYFPEN